MARNGWSGQSSQNVSQGNYLLTRKTGLIYTSPSVTQTGTCAWICYRSPNLTPCFQVWKDSKEWSPQVRQVGPSELRSGGLAVPDGVWRGGMSVFVLIHHSLPRPGRLLAWCSSTGPPAPAPKLRSWGRMWPPGCGEDKKAGQDLSEEGKPVASPQAGGSRRVHGRRCLSEWPVHGLLPRLLQLSAHMSLERATSSETASFRTCQGSPPT